MQTIDINAVINALNTSDMESFVYAGITFIAFTILVTIGVSALSYLKSLLQVREFETIANEDEEVIECIGLESVSAEDYLDMEDAEELQVETTPIFEIVDNVVYLATLPQATVQDTEVMEQNGVTLKENVEMAIWSARRTFRSMVKFVKDLAAAPARIAELEARVAELENEQFDYDVFEDEDAEVVTYVNRA